jgi:hypothetical protein
MNSETVREMGARFFGRKVLLRGLLVRLGMQVVDFRIFAIVIRLSRRFAPIRVSEPPLHPITQMAINAAAIGDNFFTIPIA